MLFVFHGSPKEKHTFTYIGTSPQIRSLLFCVSFNFQREAVIIFFESLPEWIRGYLVPAKANATRANAIKEGSEQQRNTTQRNSKFMSPAYRKSVLVLLHISHTPRVGVHNSNIFQNAVHVGSLQIGVRPGFLLWVNFGRCSQFLSRKNGNVIAIRV